MTFDVEAAIKAAIQIRDKMERMDEAHKIAKAPYRAKYDEITAVVHKFLHDSGQKNAATAAGTAFQKTATKYKVEDAMEYETWIAKMFADDGPWADFISFNAPKASLDEFVEKEEALPPGMTVTTTIVTQFRKPTK